MKRPTIVDVAKVAGVSKSTVSHALSGKRPISRATRRRILSAAAELGYQPNPVAQRLAGGATRTIGCIFPLLQPQIGTVELSFVATATAALNQAGYAFLLLTHMEHSVPAVERIAAAGLVDGLLLMQVRLHDPRVAWLRQGDTPFLMLGRCAENEGLAYVDADIEAGFAEVTAGLADAGHGAVAFLHQAPSDLGFAHRALAGFQGGCRRCGIEPVPVACTLSQEDGARAMHVALEQQPEITAVIVWNERAALGASEALREHGRAMQQDLTLVCTNPVALPDLVALRPTIVDIRAQTLTERATQLLLEMVAYPGDAMPQELIRPHVIPGARR